MADNGSSSNHKNDKSAEEKKKSPDSDENSKNAVDDDNGAIQHLIYHSFYPLTCMVPLGDDFMTIKEQVPEFMKAKSNDTLLQETIKTFHILMKEKDDEILNLRRQVKNDDTDLVKMTSEIIQTDLTLEACDDMERRLNELSESLPEKVEMINQLKLEKSKLQKSVQNTIPEDESSRINQLEEELNDSLKNLLELEENNLAISKENKDLKQSYLELKWQLDEVNDLKVEVELAKIQTEEEMLHLKESLKEPSNRELGNTHQDCEKLIAELRHQLRDAISKSKLIPTEGNASGKEFELPELIDQIKDKILNNSSSGNIVQPIKDILPQYEDRLGVSDMEVIDGLVTLSETTDTSHDDLKTIINILDSIVLDENGDIDKSRFMDTYQRNTNDNKRQGELNNKTKGDLQEYAFSLALMLRLHESLTAIDVGELKKEYSKLEVILNLLNPAYKMTAVVGRNRMSTGELIQSIIRLRAFIYDICMHSFWMQIFLQSLDESSHNCVITMSTVDRAVFSELLFPGFTNEDSFPSFFRVVRQCREVLLVGEATQTDNKVFDLQMMKILSLDICHDISNHLLPIFPKEIRYLIRGQSVEDSVSIDYNLLQNISQTFLLNFTDSFVTNSDLLDLLVLLDFEGEIFSVSAKSSTADHKVWKLATSSVTNKPETTLTKPAVNKNGKELILRKIMELENVLNLFNDKVSQEYSKRKSESELLKSLIERKETLLKIVFKDTFRPNVEKLPVSKGSVYLSCVGKDRLGLDYWIKILLEKYRLKQLNQFKDLPVEDLSICVTRLAVALKMLNPTFVQSESDLQKNKSVLALTIVKYRKKLKSIIDYSILGKISKLQYALYIDEKSEQDHVSRFQDLKDIFPIDVSYKTKLEDVLQRLYDVDCEIYPGVFDQNIEKKDFSSISESVLAEEIIKLRLVISAYVISPFEGALGSDSNIVDCSIRYKNLKDIEMIMLKIEPNIVDDDLIDSQRKVLRNVIMKLKKKNNIDDEKLKNCFVSLKKIECTVNNSNFDLGKVSKEYDKINGGNERLEMVLKAAENLLNNITMNNTTKKHKQKISDGYRKVEELLSDIESKISVNDENIHKTWAYTVWEKTTEISEIISTKKSEQGRKEQHLRDDTLHNLDDIKKWASWSSDWRKTCFNKLNNLIRKVNSKIKNRIVAISGSDNLDMTDNFQDEKNAFEKAFSKLEESLNSLMSTTKKDVGKTEEIDLERYSDDQFREIILALEKEINGGKFTKSEEENAKEWLDGRSRDQLIDDCNNLVHKSLLVKIENLLERSDCERRLSSDRAMKENHVSQFEDDINAKLAKYEELCDTVERLKMPQTDVPRRAGSSNELLNSATYTRRRNVLTHESQANNLALQSPALRSSTSQLYQQPDNDEDVDLYFQQRLDELQKFIKSPSNLTVKNKERLGKQGPQSGSNVVVDGFELEDERTPRYYSMKLQDIQHERKEDEMGALIHHIDKHRSDLLKENRNLQEQLHASKIKLDNQEQRLATLEKMDDILRRKLSTLETVHGRDTQDSLHTEEIQLMRQDKQRLNSAVLNGQKIIDQLHSDHVSLESANVNLQHENHNLIIKNQYLERSIKKMEELCEDLVQQLAYCKTQSERILPETNGARSSPAMDTDTERKLRLTEKDKIELVKKLDIIDQQNKLLRKHCEKLNTEVSELTRKLAESQDKADTYLRQNHQLSEMLDKMNSNKSKSELVTNTYYLRNKDEEVKQLRNQILQLEMRIASANDSPSAERLKQEIIQSKDKEIVKLAEQVETLQESMDDTRAQLDVKDYETRKMQALIKQLQNKVGDNSYSPPPGYRLVKDF